MGVVLKLPAGHALASVGYRSGRNSSLGIPLIRDTATTRKGGTSSHCETACAEMPSGAASAPTPPAALMARLRASFLSLMGKHESIAFTENQALLHCLRQAVLYSVEMTLGNRIKAARAKLRLSQKELGERFGISSAAVSAWERDETVPEFDRLRQLPAVLKIPASWLLNGSGDPPNDDDLPSVWDGLDKAQKRQLARFLKSLVEDSDEAA